MSPRRARAMMLVEEAETSPASASGDDDADILALVREERLVDAARIARARGRPAQASALFERACDWTNAAEQALQAKDGRRAIELALRAGDDSLAERASRHVIAQTETTESIAEQLALQGHDVWAAPMFEAVGRPLRAAEAWERAGDAVRASRLFEQLRDVPRAVHVLEAALRRDPCAWAAALALGSLLVRLGKAQAAVRLLQRIPGGAPERRDALARMVEALLRLGLAQAANEATGELEALGGAALLAPSDSAREAPSRGLLFGRFEVKAQVASSPVARVLDCTDPIRGERVAVKLFALSEGQGAPRATVTRFARELRDLHARPHPNIVPLRDLFAEDAPATVLAWMDGGTLEQMLSRGAIAPARAVEIVSAVLSALAEAHRRGILHRDLKPGNVLFDAAGAPRVSDFGTALLSDATRTVTVGPFGTMGYKSPEEREGRAATARSDIYAAGALLHEMLTGLRPSAAEATLRRPSAVDSQLHARHDAVLARLTARDPASRPTDAAEARAEILALTWPTTFRRPSPAAADDPAPPARPRADRVESAPDGSTRDTWTGRAIERLPLSDARLALARAFALADHPALQTVLRVDREGVTLWLLPIDGTPADCPLTSSEGERLAEALAALHAAGGAHGSIDSAHVTRDPAARVLLRFPRDVETGASAEEDRRALDRLR